MSRFDPSDNVNALLGGVRTGIAMSEERRRAERDQQIAEREAFIMGLEREERDQQAIIFQQQQAANKAAQQFNANQYENLIGRPTFNQTVPGGADAVISGEAFGTDAGLQGMAKGVQQVQQQQPLFAALPPALQQHYLAPLQKEMELRERRKLVEDWADEQFPTQPEMRMAVLEDWDARNLHSLPEATIQNMRNNRPINVEQFRMQLEGVGVTPDQINQLLAASFADKAGVPGGAITQAFKPQDLPFDPAAYGTRLQQGGIDPQSAQKLQQIATVIGKEPPASLALKILQPGGADPEAVYQDLVAMYPQGDPARLRATANMLARGMSVDRPEVSISGTKRDESYKKSAEYMSLSRDLDFTSDEYKQAQQRRDRTEAWLNGIRKPTEQQKQKLRDADADVIKARNDRDRARQGLEAFEETRGAAEGASTAPQPSPSPQGPGLPQGAPVPLPTTTGAGAGATTPVAPMPAPVAPVVAPVVDPNRTQAALQAAMQEMGIQPGMVLTPEQRTQLRERAKAKLAGQ